MIAAILVYLLGVMIVLDWIVMDHKRVDDSRTLLALWLFGWPILVVVHAVLLVVEGPHDPR